MSCSSTTAARSPSATAPRRQSRSRTEPAVLGSCEPSGFGCWDREAGNATADLINSLLEQTGHGRSLTAPQMHRLFEVVGDRQTERAGLGLELAGRRHGKVVPGTAYEQAEALRTLLAQSVYPGIAPRFRPLLQRSPVVQAVPFPETRHVSAGQAQRLASVPGRVRHRLVELWRSARDNDGLSEQEIGELTVLFGLRILERLELRRHPVRALRELLHRSERLLAAKLRRVRGARGQGARGRGAGRGHRLGDRAQLGSRVRGGPRPRRPGAPRARPRRSSRTRGRRCPP